MRCCNVCCSDHSFINVLATTVWRRFVVEIWTRILDVWSYDLWLVAIIQRWEWTSYCQLISWGIVFAFCSCGPANSTCIVKKWMSLPLTFYVRKFHKVHECKLTSINHRRLSCSDHFFQCICNDGVETIRCWNWNSYSGRLNPQSSSCRDN